MERGPSGKRLRRSRPQGFALPVRASIRPPNLCCPPTVTSEHIQASHPCCHFKFFRAAQIPGGPHTPRQAAVYVKPLCAVQLGSAEPSSMTEGVQAQQGATPGKPQPACCCLSNKQQATSAGRTRKAHSSKSKEVQLGGAFIKVGAGGRSSRHYEEVPLGGAIKICS